MFVPCLSRGQIRVLIGSLQHHIIIKFIDDKNYRPTQRLAVVQDANSTGSDSAFDPFDQLYMTILNFAPRKSELIPILGAISLPPSAEAAELFPVIGAMDPECIVEGLIANVPRWILAWLKKIPSVPRDLIKLWEDYEYMAMLEKKQLSKLCSRLDLTWTKMRSSICGPSSAIWRDEHGLPGLPARQAFRDVTLQCIRQMVKTTSTLAGKYQTNDEVTEEGIYKSVDHKRKQDNLVYFALPAPYSIGSFGSSLFQLEPRRPTGTASFITFPNGLRSKLGPISHEFPFLRPTRKKIRLGRGTLECGNRASGVARRPETSLAVIEVQGCYQEGEPPPISIPSDKANAKIQGVNTTPQVITRCIIATGDKIEFGFSSQATRSDNILSEYYWVGRSVPTRGDEIIVRRIDEPARAVQCLVTGVTGGGAPFSLATTTTVSRHTELNVRLPGFNPPKSFLHRSDMPAFTKTISSLSKAELLSAAATFHFDATGSVDDLRTRLKAHMAANRAAIMASTTGPQPRH
ncbi:hypothetical protein B0H13DRAFT_2414142 [Mycena leptocephala]|nr:hypothetical protein B0H13DRAFT_2414142 [Mycena leptocephala]